MLTTHFHRVQPDSGDEETDGEEDTVLANATTSNNPENEDPTLENVTVESDSEDEEEEEEEENTVLPNLPTNDEAENMELHELTEDKQDDYQEQLEVDLLAEFAIQEEERQQAARQNLEIKKNKHTDNPPL
jgi:hypothetical protein